MSSVLATRGYRFSPQTLAAFHTALGVRRFVVLAGPSGVGKTLLAREYGDLMELPQRHFLMLTVRPDWGDGRAMLGYPDAAQGRYHSTPFLRLLLDAIEGERTRQRRRFWLDGEDAPYGDEVREAWRLPYVVVLDEFNRTDPELYLTDIMNAWDSGWLTSGNDAGLSQGLVRLHDRPGNLPDDDGTAIPPEVHLPSNLSLIGTVNTESTGGVPLSAKVFDRCFTVELNGADLGGYLDLPERRVGRAPRAPKAERHQEAIRRYMSSVLADYERYRLGRDLWSDQEDMKTLARAAAHVCPWAIPALEDLGRRLAPFDMSIGYRAADEILAFVAVSTTSSTADGITPATAFDLAVRMKVLPQLSVSGEKADAMLQAVEDWAKGTAVSCQQVEAKVSHMRRRLEASGEVRFL